MEESKSGAWLDEKTGRPVYALSKGGHIKFVASLSIGFLFLFALYNAVISVFLPNLVQKITESHGGDKVAAFSLVMMLTTLFTFLAQPLAGALSDRTRSFFGSRSPWITGGSFIGGVCLSMTAGQTTIIGLTVFWVIAAVTLNMAHGPLITTLADRVPAEKRGVASGFVGATQTAGGTLGIIFGGWVANRDLSLGFYFFGIGVFVISLLFCLFNREPSTKQMRVEPFKWSSFLSQFWMSPTKYPDFNLVFVSRFFRFLGYQAVVNFQLYMLRDYIGMSNEYSNEVIGHMALVQFFCLVASSLFSGYISDKFQSRKPLVIISSLIMAASFIFPLIMKNELSMLIMAGILGLGFGSYMSIDLALAIQVLPEKGANAGKDLGVLNIGISLGQMIATPIGAFLFSYSSTYASVLIWAIVAVLLSGLLVVPIKSVK